MVMAPLEVGLYRQSMVFDMLVRHKTIITGTMIGMAAAGLNGAQSAPAKT
jgi:hypothetical protein